MYKQKSLLPRSDVSRPVNSSVPEALFEDLQEFGLDPKEAKVYLTLATRGASRASAVASQAGLARVDTYRTLTRLMERGIVQATLHRPMKFVPVPIEQALENLVDLHRSAAARLEKKREALAALWATARLRPAEAVGERFTVLQGRSQFFSALRALLTRATNTVDVKTTKNGVIRLYNAALEEDFEKAVGRGVKVRILCPVDASYTEILQRFAAFAEVHHSEEVGSSQFVVADAAEAIVSTFLDDSLKLRTPIDTSLWTNSRGFATSTRAFFDELWAKSTEYEVILKAKLTGKPVPLLRMVSGEVEIRDRVEEILSGASRRVAVIAGERGAAWLFQYSQLVLFSEVVERQVAVNLLIHVTGSNLRLLGEVCERFEAKHFEAAFDGIYLLADDVQILVVELPESPLGVKSIPKAGFYTNEASFVRSMTLLFNQLWATGGDGRYRVQELQAEERGRAVVAACADLLSSVGYTVEAPGRIIGQMQIERTFSLVAKKRAAPETFITLDVLVQPRILDSSQVASACAKRSDILSSRSFLLVAPGATPGVTELTDFYRVELVVGGDAREVIDNFRKAMKGHRAEVSALADG